MSEENIPLHKLLWFKITMAIVFLFAILIIWMAIDTRVADIAFDTFARITIIIYMIMETMENDENIVILIVSLVLVYFLLYSLRFYVIYPIKRLINKYIFKKEVSRPIYDAPLNHGDNDSSFIVHIDMYERLKILKKYLKLQQTEIDNKLELPIRTMIYYENGERKIADNSINFICNTFNVNRDWLFTGEGEMLNDQVEDKEKELLSSPNQRVYNSLVNMTEEEVADLSKYIEKNSSIDNSTVDKDKTDSKKKIG